MCNEIITQISCYIGIQAETKAGTVAKFCSTQNEIGTVTNEWRLLTEMDNLISKVDFYPSGSDWSWLGWDILNVFQFSIPLPLCPLRARVEGYLSVGASRGVLQCPSYLILPGSHISSAFYAPWHHGNGTGLSIRVVVGIITLQFEYWCYWFAWDKLQVL